VTAAELLEPFAPLDRVRPRRLDDPELLAFAGVSRHGVYRLIKSHTLVPERGPERGSRCFLTLEQVAQWRASRYLPESRNARRQPGVVEQESSDHANSTS